MIRLRRSAAIAALALTAALLASCGGGGEQSPREILEGVSFAGVESAGFDAALEVEAKGRQAADVDIDVSGKFEAEGSDLPRLTATATVQGKAPGGPLDFEGGVTLLGGHGFVNYKGSVYEIDPNNFGIARSLFLPGSQGQGKAGPNAAACRDILAAVPIDSLVEQPRNEGSAEVDGEATTKLSGQLDAGALAELLDEMIIDLDCRVQLEAISPVPLAQLRQIGDELEQSVKQGRIEVYVGDDDIVRRLVADLSAERQGQQVAVALDLTLSGVNEPQQIGPPPGAARSIQALFLKLGINPIVFVTSSGGEVAALLLEKVAADALP